MANTPFSLRKTFSAFVSQILNLFDSTPLDAPAGCSNTVCLSAVNDASNLPSFYIGETGTLDVKLVNASGASVDLPGTLLSIQFADNLGISLASCDIDLPNWTFDKTTGLLKFNGQSGSWGQSDANALQFKITGVQSTKTQEVFGSSLQITFQWGDSTNNNNNENLPSTLTAPLDLTKKPDVSNARLDQGLLQLSLDNALGKGGIVYVSPDDGDILENTLYLNIVNTGSAPVSSGKNWAREHPQVVVSFVYGSTPGALAPDSKNDDNSKKIFPPNELAWNIQGNIKSSPGNDWSPPGEPKPADPDRNPGKAPVWTFKPADNNQGGVIGAGDAAALQLAFNPVVSQTLPGLTLMLVRFTGFAKNDQQLYDTAVFPLVITKQNPPANRGALDLSSPTTLINVTKSTQPIKVTLTWKLLFADNIEISLTSHPTHLKPFTKTYGSGFPQVDDSAELTLEKFEQDASLLFTIKAFSAKTADNPNGVLLNQMQHSVELQVNYFTDGDDQEYRLVRVGTQLWFAENWNADAGEDSTYYNNNSGNATKYGRLYDWAGIQGNRPDDWHFPTAKDWETLFNNFTYDQLIAGGSSGFNALLGGYGDTTDPQNTQWSGNETTPGEQQPCGYYWTGTPDGQNAFYVVFNSNRKMAYKSSASWPKATSWLACRFVKNI